MSNATRTDGVVLAGGETGSVFFQRVLQQTAAAFPRSFAGLQVPAGSAFKKTYGDAVVRFEAARLAGGERVAVARALRGATFASLHLSENGQSAPVLEALRQQVAPPPTVQRAASGGPTPVEVPLDGTVYRGRQLYDLVGRLHDAHHLTDAAARALRWMAEQLDAREGRLDLRGERFVLLGASAELSPVQLLLDAGAEVRWLDVKPPPATLHGTGTVVASAQPDDLLTRPREAVAAIRAFAAHGPVHLGLFAYAPGASRELRLAGVMDAMVQTLGPTVVKSVSLFISPTSPGELQPEDAKVAASRADAPKWWQRGFATVRSLEAPGAFGTPAVARAVIGLQGAAYQAAQYLTKIISSEVLAADGLEGAPVTLSANVAGITNTRSLAHPLFQVGFVGAPRFGVRIFEPATTRALSGLLMLHDLMNPQAPAAATSQPGVEARAKAVHSEQIHGGVYDLPWRFETAVRTAALLGAAQRPGLLFKR